eukprot:3940935-Rhodomonas_salina.1
MLAGYLLSTYLAFAAPLLDSLPVAPHTLSHSRASHRTCDTPYAVARIRIACSKCIAPHSISFPSVTQQTHSD